MSKRSFFRREFLNNEEDGGIAFIRGYINEPNNEGDFDAGLSIADCNRIVELDFQTYGESRDNVRQKALRLRRVVNAYVAVLLAQLDEKK